MKHYIFVDHSGSVVFCQELMDGLMKKAREIDPNATLFAFSHDVRPIARATEIAGGPTLFSPIELFLQKNVDAYPDKITVITDDIFVVEQFSYQHKMHPERWTFIVG